MTSASVPSSAREEGHREPQSNSLPRYRATLSPWRLAAAVWLVALGYWALADPQQVLAVTGAPKMGSRASFTISVLGSATLCAAAFVGGFVERQASQTRRARSSVARLEAFLATADGRRTLSLSFLVPSVASSVLIVFALWRAGGIGSLLGQVEAGTSVVAVLGSSLGGAIPRILIAVTNVFVVTAALLAVSIRSTADRRLRLRAMLVGAAGFSAIVGLLTADRLIFAQFLVAYAVASGMWRLVSRRRLFTLRAVAAAAVVVGALVLVWVTAEYTRGYTTRVASDPSGTEVGTPLEFAQDRFGAYYLSSINNLQALIEEGPSYSAPERTLPFLFTLSGTTQGGEEHLAEVLVRLYGPDPLTTFTFVGYLYNDWGLWFLGVVALVGGGCGACYVWAFRSPFAFLVYPLVAVALLDSARIAMFWDTRFVVGVLAAWSVSRVVDRAPSTPRRR